MPPDAAVITLFAGKEEARNHPVADFHIADFRSHGRHYPGRLVTQDVRQVRNISMPSNNVKIGSADAARARLHQNLLRRDCRYGNVPENQRLRNGFQESCLHETCF